MKRIILIPDSFKGTMSSSTICSIMKKAILDFFPDAAVRSIPVADGGEGTVDAFLEALGGKKITVTAQGPYGKPMEASYGILPDNTAVIEMASTSGYALVGDDKRPEATTTYGTGELMLDAARHGCRKIIMGLGGSSTNDAGCGCAAACGVSFLDRDGRRFTPVGGTLSLVERVDTKSLSPLLSGVSIVTMCDIDNPFYGETGAAAVFAPQKGADAKMVSFLDDNLRALARVIRRDLGIDVQSIPGSGAAGGMGGGMAAFFSSRLEMGIETVLDAVHFDTLLGKTDLVFTGEGKIDGQSLRGKVVIGVARKAKAKGVPVIAIVGDIADEAEEAYKEGVSAIFSTNRLAIPFAEAGKRAEKDMDKTMRNLMRFMKNFC